MQSMSSGLLNAFAITPETLRLSASSTVGIRHARMGRRRSVAIGMEDARVRAAQRAHPVGIRLALDVSGLGG